MLLPTYEDATSHDYWNVVAPYVPSADLCSAALVCRRWHEIFAPHLWGNPASHFATENDTVFTALSSFKRALPRARFYVRQMTHTLYLPPAHAEFYGGPHADWLLTVMRRLPNLQCLMVDGLPFFDHAALLHTRRAITTIGGASIGPAEFPLRMLSAARCLNCTHTGLSEALVHFTGLIHLDLSYTTGSRHWSVLQALSSLPNLQSLKLRGVGLTDDDVRAIGKNTSLQLRFLDVRDNLLTDESALILLEHCFKYFVPAPPDYSVTSEQQVPQNTSLRLGTTAFRNRGIVNISGLLRNRLALDIPQDLAFDDDSLGGITDISLSGNRFSEQGICALVRTSRVRVLDVGQLSDLNDQSLESDCVYGFGSAETLSASDALVTTLAHFGSSSLNHLRIHHSIVTGSAGHVVSDTSVGETLDVDGPRPVESAHALGTRYQELDPELHPSTRTRVTGNSEQASGPKVVHEVPRDLPSSTLARAGPGRRVPTESDGNTPLIPAKGDEEWSFTVGLSEGAFENSSNKPASSHSPRLRSRERPRTFSASREEREKFTQQCKTTSPFLTPAHLPALDTLVLTDVPEFAHDSTLADRLIEFIKCCAALTTFARDEARVAYHHPPGRSAASFEQEYVRSVIALKRVVIEMKPSVGYQQAKAPCTSLVGKSSTTDEDSEALWTAAESDFTFFDEKNDERTPGRQPTSFYMDHKGSLAESEDQSLRSHAVDIKPQPTYNVISRLAEFRKDRIAAFDRATESGLTDPIVEGYWPGEVRVERPHLDIP